MAVEPDAEGTSASSACPAEEASAGGAGSTELCTTMSSAAAGTDAGAAGSGATTPSSETFLIIEESIAATDQAVRMSGTGCTKGTSVASVAEIASAGLAAYSKL